MLENLYILPILLFSVIVHEIAHGWMAYRLGDPTARDMGRLTLNPIPHIDLVGSILVPVFSLAAAGRVLIAWAKPVPVNPMNFSHLRRDDILVSVVGPLSNFLMALVCTFAVITIDKLVPSLSETTSLSSQVIIYLRDMFVGGITVNVVLGVFNMLPVPPLDGSHVVASLLPPGAGKRFRSIGFLGIFIILILMRWQPFSEFFNGVIGIMLLPFDLLYKACVG